MADSATSCKYDEVETIGRGRFGVVKRVERWIDKKEFACKTITVVPSPDNPSVNDAKHEYEVLQCLHHPNIVEYVDFESTDHEARIYMELCRGGNLKDWIKARRFDPASQEPDSYLPESVLWSVILQLTSALTYCHFGWNPTGAKSESSMTPNFRTVLHRDLKPANILISSTDGPLVIKLGDFGLAKFMDLEHTLSTFVGTRPYLAPEIIDNEATGCIRWTKHSDVYSLGCIIYEICTLELLSNSKKADPQRVPASYSDSVRSFIDRCVSREPHHRPDARELFQSASQVYNRVATPRERVEFLTANPSTINLLDHQLLGGVRSLSGLFPQPVVDVQIPNEEGVWTNGRPVPGSVSNALACPIANEVGTQVLDRPDESLAGPQHGFEARFQVSGFDVSSSSISTGAAFSWAIRRGLWDDVGLLMEHGLSVETRVWFCDQRGHQIDHSAHNNFEAYSKVLSLVSYLGLRHPDGEQALDLSMTLIHHATLQRNRDVLDLLIGAGADVNAAAIFNTTPKAKVSALMIAATLSDEWIIKKLLKAGADPSLAFGVDALSPLILTAKMGLSKSIKLLIERGAGACLAADGMPASLNAIFWTQEEATRMVLLNCADTSLQNFRTKDLDLCLQRVLSEAAFSKHHTLLRTLLDWGIAKEFPGYRGRSPFLLAAANADFKAMKLLLDEGANAEATDDDGCTALHLVADYSADDQRKEQVAELLVEAGADMNARDNRQFTPLVISVCKDLSSNEKMAQMLLNHGADAQARGEEGTTSLMHASMRGNVRMMKMLLQVGVDATIRDNKERTALYFAAAAEDNHEARFKLLQQHGADIAGLSTDVNDTVVHSSIMHCTVKAVERLLKLFPAAIDLARQRTIDNMNALDIAAANGKREHLEFLLEQVIDIDMESKSWVLYHAIVGRSVACVKLVISTFAGLASRAFKLPKPRGDAYPTISTPLHEACYGNPEVALLILEHGGDVTALNDLGWAPLHDACIIDNAPVVRQLLQRGNETMSWAAKMCPNFETGRMEPGQPPWMLTPLHFAVAQGATKALKALISAGADIDEPTHDKYGFTPLHLAIYCNQTAAFELLIRKGADYDKASRGSDATPLLLALDKGYEKLAVELIYYGVRTSWTTPDGSTITALNISAEKGLMRVTSALLGEALVARAESMLDNVPCLGCSNPEDVDTSIHDRNGGLAMTEGILWSSNKMTPANFDKMVLVAVKQRNLNLLHRLAHYQKSQSRRRHDETMVPRSELVSRTTRSGRDGPAKAFREAAKKGLVDFIQPLVGICGRAAQLEGSDGFFPIHVAAFYGHWKFLRRLLSETNAKVDEETRDGTQRTALHIAAERGHLDVVKTLLSYGAEVDRGEEDDWSALHLAASAGQLEVVNLLIQWEADLNIKSRHNSSPVLLAVENGRLAVVEALIQAGAAVDDVPSRHGRTALFYAASGQDAEVVEMLLKAGADPNQRDYDVATPLLQAVRADGESNYLEEAVLKTVRILLEHGANVEACDVGGWNALRSATHRGWTSVVRALLEHNVDLHARDKDGDDALQLATLNDNQEIAEILLEYGADIFGTNVDGNTPLHTAALHGYASMVELLVRKGAELECTQAETGSTPMHLAAKMGHVASMQVLHFHGANITSSNSQQMTPLLLAVRSGHTEATAFLIQQGVDINAPTTNVRKTALHFAINHKDEQLLELLLQNGANPNVYPPTINNGKKSGMCTKFRNPLSYCVYAGWLDGIQLLLKYEADVNSNWLEGGTALHAAAKFSRQGAARLLLENKARTDIWDGRRAPLHSAAASGDEEVLEALLEYKADPNERDLFGLTALDIAKQEPRCEEAIRLLEPVTTAGESGWKLWKST